MGADGFGWPPIYEADQIADVEPLGRVANADAARLMLLELLGDAEFARAASYQMQLRARNLFDAAHIGPQWQALLSRVAVAA